MSYQWYCSIDIAIDFIDTFVSFCFNLDSSQLWILGVVLPCVFLLVVIVILLWRTNRLPGNYCSKPAKFVDALEILFIGLLFKLLGVALITFCTV
jgi:hypothetical protein